METLRVLVVDDEPNARSALCELLRDEGYQVETARDGVEALERAATFQPQLVLSDVAMPRMNGIELRAALAARTPPPIVVLMSAHLQKTDELFVSKPIDVGELCRTLATACGRVRNA